MRQFPASTRLPRNFMPPLKSSLRNSKSPILKYPGWILRKVEYSRATVNIFASSVSGSFLTFVPLLLANHISSAAVCGDQIESQHLPNRLRPRSICDYGICCMVECRDPARIDDFIHGVFLHGNLHLKHSAHGLEPLGCLFFARSARGFDLRKTISPRDILREDTRFMYLETVEAVVKAAIEETTSAKGIKLIKFNEYSPILGELYKPTTVQLPRST